MHDCLKCKCLGYLIVHSKDNKERFIRISCPVCKGKGFVEDSPFKYKPC